MKKKKKKKKTDVVFALTVWRSVYMSQLGLDGERYIEAQLESLDFQQCVDEGR